MTDATQDHVAKAETCICGGKVNTWLVQQCPVHAQEDRWAFDLLDEIDPRARFSPNEINIAIRSIIAARRKLEAE